MREHHGRDLITNLTKPGRQPNMNRSDRMTWIDPEGRTWRIERVTGRWQLSRYSPATETWQRIGSYPTRSQAIQVAYSEDDES